MRENSRGDRWCASDQIADGGSSVGPVHRVSHQEDIDRVQFVRIRQKDGI